MSAVHFTLLRGRDSSNAQGTTFAIVLGQKKKGTTKKWGGGLNTLRIDEGGSFRGKSRIDGREPW